MISNQDTETEQTFLQAVLYNLADGVVACNATGQLTVFNQATREFHGLPEKPIPAEEWADYYNLFEVEGKTPLKKERIPLFRALTEGKVTHAELDIIPKTGQMKSIVASGQAIKNENRNVVGAVVIRRDQTKIKKIEEH